MQYVYRPGWPKVDIDVSPGLTPPILIITSRRARPIVALARKPGPKTPNEQLSPIRGRIGPLTRMRGAEKCVDVDIPWRLKAGSHAASTAASTTERYSGRHPAMTALTAIFSTVARP